MKKIIIQGLILMVLFFSTLFVLNMVDWMTVFKVEKITNNTEKKLGELFWEIFQKTESENKNQLVIHSIDSIVTKICNENNIDRKLIKAHVLNKNEINAFALPNGHLIIYSNLILASENQEELIGVICHEIAHIELNHVMKKLIKEVGLSVLISMTTTNNGPQIIKETAKMLSSTAFDRNLEKEADIKAVEYLIAAKINPEPLADFLFKLSDEENETLSSFSWISTHPDSKARATYIKAYSQDKNVENKLILTQKTWGNLKDILRNK
ncbi:MAG: peptidase M48 [Bacteroidetes bacterium HGW-Bacteroidetes-3]|jgi:predicted Zn-dependent protease|nr:MAG: peptidase M48 [Bacteroidetes bacterium HGW-Bacteroidetes-3]